MAGYTGFQPWSYEDQLRKYMPGKANTILKQYGWKGEKRPQIMQDKICVTCYESFIPKSGRQLNCKVNSKGQNCQMVYEMRKYYRNTNEPISI
jgi:hypothetical protein